jgi:hypothetical protein
MDNHFGGIIWTNHALDRLRERGIKQGDAWATWRNPQISKKGTISGSWVYYRNYNGTQIEVVAKQNEKREWIILSVWSRSVFQANAKKKSNLWSNLIKLLLK